MIELQAVYRRLGAEQARRSVALSSLRPEGEHPDSLTEGIGHDVGRPAVPAWGFAIPHSNQQIATRYQLLRRDGAPRPDERGALFWLAGGSTDLLGS